MAQTIWPTSHARWFGIKRHYFTGGETIIFALTNNDGTPYTTGSSSNAINTAEVLATVTTLQGLVNDDLHTNPIAFGFVHLGGGVYQLAIPGEGAANNHDRCLASIGDCTINVRPTGSANFIPVVGSFSVRSDWDVRAAFTYLNQPDRLSGCINVRRWYNKLLLDKPLDAVGAANGRTSHLSEMTVTISDVTGNLLTLSQVGGDFQQGADSNIYFLKSITGITGARSLNARIFAKYVNGASGQIERIDADFPIVAPFAA